MAEELLFRTFKQWSSGCPYSTSDFRRSSFPLDVSSRESILEAKKLIEEKEGKLHILINKCDYWRSSLT